MRLDQVLFVVPTSVEKVADKIGMISCCSPDKFNQYLIVAQNTKHITDSEIQATLNAHATGGLAALVRSLFANRNEYNSRFGVAQFSNGGKASQAIRRGEPFSTVPTYAQSLAAGQSFKPHIVEKLLALSGMRDEELALLSLNSIDGFLPYYTGSELCKLPVEDRPLVIKTMIARGLKGTNALAFLKACNTKCGFHDVQREILKADVHPKLLESLLSSANNLHREGISQPDILRIISPVIRQTSNSKNDSIPELQARLQASEQSHLSGKKSKNIDDGKKSHSLWPSLLQLSATVASIL